MQISHFARVAMTTGKDQRKYCNLIGQNLTSNSLARDVNVFANCPLYCTVSVYAKIADLGVARIIPHVRAAATMTKGPGSIIYMPP